MNLRLKPLGMVVLAGVSFLLGVLMATLYLTMRVDDIVTSYRVADLREQLPETYNADYEPIFDREIDLEFPHDQFWSSREVAANTIYFGDYEVEYKNGGKSRGQEIINDTHFASTWGGAAEFSGTDHLNTHFIGHTDKQFYDIQNEKWIVVTDSVGRAYTYAVTSIYLVEDNGIELRTGEDRLAQMIDVGSEEKITLQTCVTDDVNWIVEAVLVE